MLIGFIKVAPAHYPCGPNEPGQNLEVSPHIGWANAIPDANATIDFVVRGRPLKFTGYGYHDKVTKAPHHSSSLPIQITQLTDVY
jgi:hypothetical protein